MASRASSTAYVLPGALALQVAGGADAGQPGTDDEHVDVVGGMTRQLIAGLTPGSA